MTSQASRDRFATPHRILIVRALPGLGDLLCVVPALRALRLAFPQAEITLLGLPSAQSFAARFSHYLNGWLEFPGFPGIAEVAIDPLRISSFLSQMPSFDLALQLHGDGSIMNAFVSLLAARQSAGCYLPGRFCPDPEFYLPYPDAEPEVWRSLRLLDFLDVPLQGDQLEFPIAPAEQQAAVALMPLGRYVCIHPGASTLARCWPIDRFVQVADRLAAQGLQVVLTGTAAEASLTRSIASALHYPAIDLAGKTELGTLAALLKGAQLLVCNDTGVSHLAAALQVPSVVIFSDSDLRRWCPLDRHLHRSIDARLWADGGVNQAIEQAFDLLQLEAVHA